MIQLVQQVWQRHRSVLAYLIFGGLTTAVNFILFGVLTLPAVNCPYLISNVIAWFGSVLFAYVTNRRWVFDSQATTLRARVREVASFFWYRALSLGVDELIMFVGVSLLAGNGMLVKLIDQVIIVLINWVFSKYLIFKK
ncbi:GtrA family protein [Lactiplantibacillus garii]|uniref:GtrA family protein n=1 Tax=Lactiplantibacillus garii TaxID=2306423 RepID=A0A3R8KEP3_9LACO|nr:GtrA family protein [Lactiplantibacillus garii]RRK10491.1 GtrA family protein [Lactiplantibacillus garii]